MPPRRRPICLFLFVALCLALPLHAGPDGSGVPSTPLPQDSGTAGLKQMLVRLHTTARLMQITAHPDDEDGGMLVLESRGKGDSVLLLTLNRGEGGQNKLGNNLFDELGVLRTLELLASDQYYGVEQRFTRVADFGFSKSADETFSKWRGHDTALADIVRVIRTFRPDVLASRFQGSASDGHGHHQAAGILAREAFRAAADPNRFPEQIRAGLQPWQPKKLYTDGFGAREDYTIQLNTAAESPLLGTSYVQFAMNGLRHQLSQGAGAWSVTPGPHYSYYKLVDSVLPQPANGREQDFFQGIDTSLSGLATKTAAATGADFLRPELLKIERKIQEADQAVARHASDAAEPLLSGLEMVTALVSQIDRSSLPQAAKTELRTNLTTKQQQLEKAAQLVLGLDLEASVEPDSALVIPGQTVRMTAELRNRGDQIVEVHEIKLDLPQGWNSSVSGWKPVSLNPGQSTAARFTVGIPLNAEYTEPYWHRDDPETQTVYFIDDEQYATLPFPPPAIKVHAMYAFQGRSAVVHSVVYGKIEGKLAPVAVVPAFSVLLDPATLVIATSKASAPTTRVQLRDYAPGTAQISLTVPAGWRAEAARESATFDGVGQSRTLTFKLEPPRPYREGRYEIKAALQQAGKIYAQGFSIVTREDLGTFYYYQPAVQHVSAVDVKIPGELRIGYVMGAGDDIPTVLQEIGLDVSLISPEELARGDLSRYGTIVLGIRAYDTRPDLRENNQRLLNYVAQGGTLVVQYNSGLADFNAGHYTPYPARLSRDRVSVEEASVKVLAPNDPIFHFPNVITDRDFNGWVQERGLYFMDQWDSHFQPLLASADPGEPPHEGGLLCARYGKGTYIYTGYAFFRQLPTGVPGAIRLFVNLVSAGHEQR